MVTLSEHNVSYGDNNQKNIFYYSCGPSEGPQIIFLHGWPANAKTWIHQLTTFSSLGFRCIAPDMPGYGRSTATKVTADYSQESIVEGLVALLADTGRDRAIWVAHDWGSGCLNSFVAHHADKCVAIANLAVPYRVIELGLAETIKYVNRDLYPKDEYPDGQWSYMRYYQQSFDKSCKFHDNNVEGFTKFLYSGARANHTTGERAFTATTVQDGGWFGGAEEAPGPEEFPDEDSLLAPDALAELIADFRKNGYFGPDAYYNNDAANNAFNTNADVRAELDMPVLFIEARYDSVCDTGNTRMADPQKRLCRNLTQSSIGAGHWVQLEKPVETNAAIARWLATEVGDAWPGAWKTVSFKRP